MSRPAPLPVVLGAILLVGTLGGTVLANESPGADALVDPNPSTDPGALTLEGTEWLLVKAQLSGAYADIPADVGATLLMQDGRAGGSGGCNSWSTSYVLDGASITFSDQITTTLMMCAGPGGDIETFYLADLPGVTGWAIDGTTLILSNETGPVLAFEPRADSGPALDGDWVVTGYNDGKGAFVPVDDGSVRLTIADGHISGTAGCNRFMGPIRQDAQEITVGPLGRTEMFCEGLMDREDAVIASLQASTSVQASDGGLTFLDAAGTIQLQLASAGAVPEASPAA
jgi:heat shock protein HslJ